jgi:hypothetical protein
VCAASPVAAAGLAGGTPSSRLRHPSGMGGTTICMASGRPVTLLGVCCLLSLPSVLLAQLCSCVGTALCTDCAQVWAYHVRTWAGLCAWSTACNCASHAPMCGPVLQSMGMRRLHAHSTACWLWSMLVPTGTVQVHTFCTRSARHMLALSWLHPLRPSTSLLRVG